MSNEPKWTYNSSQDCFYKGGYSTPNKSHIANVLNDFELKVRQLTIEKKLQYDEFRSERNAMEDKVSDLESEVERLKNELEKMEAYIQKKTGRYGNIVEDCYLLKCENERLTADLSRCQSERLSAEEVFEMVCWANETDYEAVGEGEDTVEEWIQLITAWRKSKEGERNG